MIELLAIDHNGTLACDVDRLHRGFNEVLTDRGLASVGVGEFRDRFRLPAEDMLNDYGISDHSDALERWTVSHFDTDAHPHDGAPESLRRLHMLGVRLGVLSAASPAAVKSDLKRFELLHLMEFVIGESHPKHEPLAHLVARSAGRVAYVGDTEYDISAAIVAGAIPIGFADGYRPADALRDAGAELVIDSWRDLPAALVDLG